MNYLSKFEVLIKLKIWFRERRNFILLFSTASAMLITVFAMLSLYDDIKISILIEDNWPIFVLFFSTLVMYISAFVSLKQSRLAAYTSLFAAVIGVGYYIFIFSVFFSWLTPFILIFPPIWFILCMPTILLIISLTFSIRKLRS